MGEFSTNPALVSSTDCSTRSIELLDQSRYSPYGVQIPPRFEARSLHQLRHCPKVAVSSEEQVSFLCCSTSTCPWEVVSNLTGYSSYLSYPSYVIFVILT